MIRTSRVAHSAALLVPSAFALGCDHLAASGPGWTRCVACGACCQREDGAIVLYDATSRRLDDDGVSSRDGVPVIERLDLIEAGLAMALDRRPLIAYASRTGTRRNLSALRSAGWRLLVSAAGCLRHEGFPYALDNGAWSAYTQGRPFDERAFEVAMRKLGRDADWTVIPDVVAGGSMSLELSLRWMRRVLDECQRGMLAVQDGMTVDTVRPFVGERVGIFVGGSTPWKLATMAGWSRLACERGAWCHVARVNSAKRIHRCASAGVDSFDGSSASRYAVNVPLLDAARRQLALAGCA